MWSRHAIQPSSRESVDKLHEEIHLLRQVVRQLVLQQGLYQADDPEAMRVVSLLSQLDVAHPLKPIPPEPAQSNGLDEPTLPHIPAAHGAPAAGRTRATRSRAPAARKD
jgi:hypothetical protein